MTEKEKAKDLALKFTSSTDVVKPNLGSMMMALICVEELIHATQRYSINEENNKVEVIPLQYWLDVRDEVLKLTFN